MSLHQHCHASFLHVEPFCWLYFYVSGHQLYVLIIGIIAQVYEGSIGPFGSVKTESFDS
jgi:hypothetical protein